jgi:hypothetical protein
LKIFKTKFGFWSGPCIRIKPVLNLFGVLYPLFDLTSMTDEHFGLRSVSTLTKNKNATKKMQQTTRSEQTIQPFKVCTGCNQIGVVWRPLTGKSAGGTFIVCRKPYDQQPPNCRAYREIPPPGQYQPQYHQPQPQPPQSFPAYPGNDYSAYSATPVNPMAPVPAPAPANFSHPPHQGNATPSLQNCPFRDSHAEIMEMLRQNLIETKALNELFKQRSLTE